MPSPLNITSIPAPRVPVIDERTNLMSREWYRFFSNLFVLTGSGGNPTTLTEIQYAPPAVDYRADQSNPDQALGVGAPPVPAVSDNQSLITPSMQPFSVQKLLDDLGSAPPAAPLSTAGTGTVTSVDVSGGSTGMTFSGGPITTSGTITMAGTLGIGYGGTGLATTPTNGKLLIGNGSGYTLANLTAGSNVTITNGAGSITIDSYDSGGTVTSVNVSGGTTGLTFSGGPITSSGTMTMAGTLGTANGGTGATSLTGAGIVTLTDTQTVSGQKAFTSTSNTFVGTSYTTNGSNSTYTESSGYGVLWGSSGLVLATGGTTPGTGRVAVDGLTLRPFSDNTISCGVAIQRWTVVYAVTGTINTSDATEKQQVRELSESERLVAQRVKKLIRAFKWNDAVAAKGDGARTHFGVMAQDVQAAFAAEGLDASQYGLFCSDTWTTLDGTSQTRLGVRYDELLAFVIAAL